MAAYPTTPIPTSTHLRQLCPIWLRYRTSNGPQRASSALCQHLCCVGKLLRLEVAHTSLCALANAVSKCPYCVLHIEVAQTLLC